MSFLLQWLLLACSSFNTLLPLWLGLTVLLNAERRAWGVWLAGVSLIVTGIFFIFHSALLEGSLMRFLPKLGIWWHLGWAPIIALPLAWYLAMLWFAGFWERREARTPPPTLARHRWWLSMVATLGLLVILLVLLSKRQIPDAGGYVSSEYNLGLSRTPAMAGFPVLAAVYPAYLLGCFLFSLDALRRLAPSGRVMGDIARRRARPWLAATSLVQIVVSILVGWALFWLAGARETPMSLFTMILTLNWFDLSISLLIATSIYFLGRAIVSYEIFTGKTLPRQGFMRYWRNAVVLAIGAGGLLSLVLTIRVPPVYLLSMAIVLVAIFHALLTWRSFRDRDKYFDRLRPFIGSQQLYDNLLTEAGTSRGDMEAIRTFEAICSDVLGVRLAYLTPLGSLAPLAGAPLLYPRGASTTGAWRSALARLGPSPETLCVALDPARHDGAVWAIPLWGQQGLIGALLVGEKLDGGVYTQEEMEVARASCERLLDMRASTEMARRLMEVQRVRLAETQVLDARTRRTLHDDVLPQLHAVALTLSAVPEGAEVIPQLSDLHRMISNLLRSMPAPVAQAVERTGLMGALRNSVNGEFRGAFDRVAWEIEPEAEAAAAGLSPLATEVFYHAAREAIRNAAKYGRGEQQPRPLGLLITLHRDDGLHLRIEDNGVGIDNAARSDDGARQGMALHGTMMAVVGGSMSVESVADEYTRVTLRIAEGR